MKQKTINILGTEIAYLDNESGDLGTILFIHGNSFSSQTFAPQFESALFNDYRLIAIDLYGHGDSGKLSNPFGYHLPNYAKLVLEFIKSLHLSNVTLAGHSLGGHVALEVLANKIEGLVSGVFVWGTPPLSNPVKEADAFLPNPAGAYLYQSTLTNEEIIEFLTQCFGNWSEELRPLIDVVAKTSTDARPSLGASVGQLNFSDELKNIEQALIPVAVAYGDKDSLMNPKHFSSLQLQNLWRNQCQVISGSHFCHIDYANEFNQLLLDYIQEQEVVFEGQNKVEKDSILSLSR